MASDSPNREELLRMAIGTAQSGNTDAARVMFRQVLSEDRRNERALMWMAKLAENKAERRQWLTRVVEVNPQNAAAQSALKKIDYRSSASDNRTILIFGVIAGIMIVLALVIIFGVVLPNAG